MFLAVIGLDTLHQVSVPAPDGSWQRKTPATKKVWMVGPEGIEPSTLGLKVPCSAGLSYRPRIGWKRVENSVKALCSRRQVQDRNGVGPQTGDV